MTANYFTHKIKVSKADIDDLNHVNNTVYVHWMDEVARNHWQFLTKENSLNQYVWVVKKHEIEYLKEVVLGDEIIAKTWVGETKGFSSIRHIAFYKNEVLVAQSKTIWVLLDAKTFKPARIRENVLKVLQAPK